MLERHDECADWIDDPTAADADRLAEHVAALAKHWTRKPAIKRARRR
jgi:hypothetical protein